MRLQAAPGETLVEQGLAAAMQHAFCFAMPEGRTSGSCDSNKTEPGGSALAMAMQYALYFSTPAEEQRGGSCFSEMAEEHCQGTGGCSGPAHGEAELGCEASGVAGVGRPNHTAEQVDVHWQGGVGGRQTEGAGGPREELPDPPAERADARTGHEAFAL